MIGRGGFPDKRDKQLWWNGYRRTV